MYWKQFLVKKIAQVSPKQTSKNKQHSNSCLQKMIGRARLSRTVTESAGNIFTVSIHNGTTKTIVTNEQQQSVSDLLKLAADAFGVDLIPFHQLRVSTSKTPLTNNSPLSSLDSQARVSSVRLLCHQSAHRFSRCAVQLETGHSR